VDDAIRRGDDDATLRDELGDLLLQVLFHSVGGRGARRFDLHDVARALITKMHVRHPHLYAPDGGEPLAERPSWEGMKAKKRRAIDEGLPTGLPALHRAHRLQDRAAGVGFDWPDAAGARRRRWPKELAGGALRARAAAGACAHDRRRGALAGPGARGPSWATCSSRLSTCAARRGARLARARQGEREVRRALRRRGAARARARHRSDHRPASPRSTRSGTRSSSSSRRWPAAPETEVDR
jgi:hypothetical protein